MKAVVRILSALALALVATQASAQVSFFERENFEGQAVTVDKPMADLRSYGFSDVEVSVVVAGDQWEFCEEVQFSGRCVVLRPGSYASLGAMGLRARILSVRAAHREPRVVEPWRPPVAPPVALPMSSRITLYEHDGYQGRSFVADRPIAELQPYGFDDHASSAEVSGGPWEVCEDARFGGRCVVLRPGRYPSLRAMGLNDRVSSVRSGGRDMHGGEDPRYPPPPLTPTRVAQIIFYEHDDFRGQSLTADRPINDFAPHGFADRASSVVVTGGAWEACEHPQFRGRCVVLRPGRYASLRDLGLNDRLSSVRAASGDVPFTDDTRYPVAPVAAQATFYEHDGFQGQSFTTDRQIGDFGRFGFADRASSVIVVGDRWEVCEHPHFAGRCVVLRPGSYPSLGSMGLNDRLSSVRALGRDARIDDHRYAPMPIGGSPDYRRRRDERLYEVEISVARAVVGLPEQRCWVEREHVAVDQDNANVPNAIVGAIIGGVLGHQIGGGTGRDVATVGGAIAGAAIGANIGRDSTPGQSTFQDVRRCERVPSQARPQYWDVTYNFRGVEHRVQMTSPPGRTLTVNERGEPRW
ncbi:beta/gamma crystallin-related protein [Rhodoferax sp.]|uniref:beta/gamma crystallin-related protein n=1 Tax=Rhodoferax sp. TaxID=50421 RepID=UPI002772FF22|nr:beta/gamma crystallin-related protein [Rhodoferax sp.]